MTTPSTPADLVELFGGIDVYLFDQLLRGNIPAGARVLDAGCGSGRNLVYLLKAGYDVSALDSDPEAIAAVRGLVQRHAPRLALGQFRAEAIEEMSFEDSSADVVLCNAVLHFARDDEHFDRMLQGLWRVLAPGGLLFCRLASSIGIEHSVQAVGAGRFRLPDRTERYLVDLERLLEASARMRGSLVDPIKTTNVQGLRCMTTWVLRK